MKAMGFLGLWRGGERRRRRRRRRRRVGMA